jgi:hypothetical protein
VFLQAYEITPTLDACIGTYLNSPELLTSLYLERPKVFFYIVRGRAEAAD